MIRRSLNFPFMAHVTPTQAMPRRITFHADGAITPHAAGAGALAHDEHGALMVLGNRRLPPMTNNEAEYAGLLLVLELAAPFRQAPIEIRMDSEIVVYQMRGRFSVNSPTLKMLHRQACALTVNFAALTFTHVPREQNRLADALAADAVAGRLWTLYEKG